MSRDILFKAKRIDNREWIDGYYTLNPDGRNEILRKCETPPDSDPMWRRALISYEVDSSTVCRHTGKEYMDCEAAYEGDIFESQVDGTRMVLRFGTYQAYCPVDKSFMDSVGFYAECPGLPDMPIGDLKDYALKVGNIFDNPELLKGTQDD